MEWLIGKTVGALLIPPGIVLLILLVAVLLTWKRPRLARGLVLLALVALYALSTPFVASGLLGLLEDEPRDPATDKSGQAIVVLGGGALFDAPEYGGATVNDYTLIRVRYAAYLYRALKKPLLVSGGPPKGNPTAEARLIKQVLENEFRTPVQWTEEASSNTLENARGSIHMLRPAGVERIYLITHAWHMPRARLVFERAGFTVIPAPTAYASHSLSGTSPGDFLPSARSLLQTSWFFHEVIGLGWYHLRLALE